MHRPFKTFNSKAFLIIYLVVVGLIFSIWLMRSDIYPADKRTLPPALKPYLVSPVKPLPQLLLHELNTQQVFTNASFEQKWSFIYFTHGYCLPECRQSFDSLLSLQQQLSGVQYQFLLINYDNQPDSTNVLKQLSQQPVFKGINILFAQTETLNKLFKVTGFLFLKTETSDSYYLEQDHTLYLIDPKGRLYAAFSPPYTANSINRRFQSIRQFYASTE